MENLNLKKKGKREKATNVDASTQLDNFLPIMLYGTYKNTEQRGKRDFERGRVWDLRSLKVLSDLQQSSFHWCIIFHQCLFFPNQNRPITK